MTIYNIIFTECGLVNQCRTFSDFSTAKWVLDKELAWHRDRYSEDEDNGEEYDSLDSEDCKCSFLFKNGDVRIEFMTSEIE